MKMPRYAPPLALFLLLLVLAPSIGAQQGAARAALDDWLEHINTASAEELETYSAAAFSEAFLSQVPLQQIGTIHQQLQAIAPFAVESLESEAPTALVAFLRAASGGWFRLQLSVSGEPPKIDGMLIQPSGPPAEGDQEAWDWDSLDELAARAAASGDLPGVAVAWARRGEAPQVGSAGVRMLGGVKQRFM